MAQQIPIQGQNQEQPDLDRLVEIFEFFVFHSDDSHGLWNGSLVSINARAQELVDSLKRNERFTFDRIYDMHKLIPLLKTRINQFLGNMQYVVVHRQSPMVLQAYQIVRQSMPALFQQMGMGPQTWKRLFVRGARVFEKAKELLEDLEKLKANLQPGPIYRARSYPVDPFFTFMELCYNYLKNTAQKARGDTVRIEIYCQNGYSPDQRDPFCRDHIYYLASSRESFQTFENLSVWTPTNDSLVKHFEEEKPGWERKKQALQQSEPSVEVNRQIRGVEMALQFAGLIRILKFTMQTLIDRCWKVFKYTMYASIYRIVVRNVRHIRPGYESDLDSVEAIRRVWLEVTMPPDEMGWRSCFPIENLEQYMLVQPFYKKVRRVEIEIFKDWGYLVQVEWWYKFQGYRGLKGLAENCVNFAKSTNENEFGFIENFEFLMNELGKAYPKLAEVRMSFETARINYRHHHPNEFDEDEEPIQPERFHMGTGR